MSLLITLGNHPALGVLVAALCVAVLLSLEVRIVALDRHDSMNRVLTLVGSGFAVLSWLFIIGHFVARLHP